LRALNAHTTQKKEGFPVNRSQVAGIVVMVALAGSLSGCCGGGTKEIKQTSPVNVETKSSGEQLIDLQKAYESGAINEQEYNKMRQDVIDKSGKK
jgi:hypothetical protein